MILAETYQSHLKEINAMTQAAVLTPPSSYPNSSSREADLLGSMLMTFINADECRGRYAVPRSQWAAHR